MSELKPRAGYTLKFKLEAVRLIKGGQVAAVTAKILGILHSECRRPFRRQITFGKLQSLAHHAVNNPRYQADKRMGGVLASRRWDSGAISTYD